MMHLIRRQELAHFGQGGQGGPYQPGADLARQRGLIRSRCRHCGTEIYGLKIRRFCSGGACQRASYRERLASVPPGAEVPSVDEYYGDPEDYEA